MIQKQARPCTKLRIVGFLQRFLHFIFYPVFYFKSLLYRNSPLPRLRHPEILLESAVKLAQKIRNGELTSEQVVKAYILRIKDVDPYLNAVVEERFTAALEEAHAVDQLLLSKTKSVDQIAEETPFLGVPITIKESIGVKGLSHGGGCTLLRGVKASEDAIIVSLIRKAGAIPLCVTNTSELCTSWESFNYVNGRTLNPYDFTRTPGGSSGGEAALISSASSVIGIGTDLAGSIRVPAMFTGIFGHKTTAGIVPVEGHYPLLDDDEFKEFLVFGPMARYAEDLTPLLKVMVGPENSKKMNLDSEVSVEDLRIFYRKSIGESMSIIPLVNELKIAMDQTIDFFKGYCQHVEELNLPEMEVSPEACMGKMFLIKNMQTIYSLMDPTLRYSKELPNTNLEFLKGLFGLSRFTPHSMLFQLYIENQGFVPTEDLEVYKSLLETIDRKLKDMLGTNGVLIYPTFPSQALRHSEILLTSAGAYYTMPMNMLGYPSCQVPIGIGKNGLPAGVQIIAAPYQDRLCIAVARKLEKVFSGWNPPDFTGKVSESNIFS